LESFIMTKFARIIPFALAAALAALAASPVAAQTSNNSQGDMFSNLLGSIFGNQQQTEQTLDNDWSQGRRPFEQRRQTVEARISAGVANGTISRTDAQAFSDEYERIVETEARYTANGSMSSDERADLRNRYRSLINQVEDNRGQQNWNQQGGAYQSIAAERGTFDARINQALQQRRISSAEAQRMRSDFQGLAQLEANYQRGGMDGRERADLQARYDGLERRLNERGFGNDRNSVRWTSFESRIAAAERNGAMPRRDAAQLRTEIGDLSRLDAAYAANGFNTNERSYLTRRYAEVDARVGTGRR
jgi:hypothetical protein